MNAIPNDTSGPSFTPPECRGTPMVLVGQGHCGNCDRLLALPDLRRPHAHDCPDHGKNFWVGAMAVAIHRETVRIVARAHGDPTRAK